MNNFCFPAALPNTLYCSALSAVDGFWLQVLSYQSYGKMVDWWAMGVLIYEMLVGQPPFDGEDEADLYATIREGNPVYPRSLTKEAMSVMKGVSLY